MGLRAKALIFGFVLGFTSGCAGIEPAGADDATAPPETPVACGGFIGAPCLGDDDYCHFEPGQCRIPDYQGECRAKPEACTREYLPVCGCDGETYSNACMANAAGTSVATEGVCP